MNVKIKKFRLNLNRIVGYYPYLENNNYFLVVITNSANEGEPDTWVKFKTELELNNCIKLLDKKMSIDVLT